MKQKLLLLILIVCVSCCYKTNAQTRISTETGTTGYDGGNGLNGTSCITFAVQNNNPYAINLESIETFKSATYLFTPATIELWYSAVATSGSSPIAAPDWINAATASLSSANIGYNKIFSGLTFSVPANTTYRFALVSNNGIAYSGNTSGSCSPQTLTADGVTLMLGEAQISASNVGYSGNGYNATTTPRWFTGAISFIPSIPCTTPPNAGLATSSKTIACSGSTFNLSLSGATSGIGLTYQWQDSIAGDPSFTDIPGAIVRTYTTTQTTTKYYRCAVTCFGNASNSAPVMVKTPDLVSGNYTINSAAASSSTNFQTFAAAVNHFACGVDGPVVYNVAPNVTGYNEQITISEIFGASDINTITFKGNGGGLVFSSVNSSDRAGITLNGAKHIILDSLVIDGSSGTYGWGVLLMNKADSNTIQNCEISVGSIGNNTNHAGIVSSANSSSTAFTGDNANYNQILNNKINGGFYSISLYGGTTANNTQNNGNVIKNNICTNFYNAAIAASAQSYGLIISGNDISRPTRTNSGSSSGIILLGNCYGVLVEKNRIHNMFDGMPANTTAAFTGILVGVKGKVGFETKIFNNIIYNIAGNGTQYGISNSSGDSMLAYHNTIVLDNAASTAGATYGFSQSGIAYNVVFRNNIIQIKRGGTGIKRALQFSTTTSEIICNNNDIDFNPGGGANNFFGQWGATNYPTLSDWQLANSGVWDALSKSEDPIFVDVILGDLKPTNTALSNMCPNLGVTTDITGAARYISPDPGAFEFLGVACTNPPNAGAINASTTIACANIPFDIYLSSNSIGEGQTYTLQKSTSCSGTWTNVTTNNNGLFNVSQSATSVYRVGVTCSGGTTVYTSCLNITTPTLVSGTFTINPIAPTAGSNFNNFADAIEYINCGINGPVIFNVAAGSVFTEKLFIPAIPGASATNTITFNGNGSAISFVPVATTDRTAVTLFGADYVTIDSFTIDISAATTFGWGILLTKQADYNTIKRCNIINNTTSTNTNLAGIVVNGSTSINNISGNNANYNTIINNSIIGGFYGVIMYGNTTANNLHNQGNIIKKNTMQDFNSYGVYALYQSRGIIVSDNEMSRPTRTNNTSVFGVALGSGCTGALVEKNRIHNLFDGASSSTSAAYGLYIVAKGKPGFENRVINNVVYNINSNGSVYGIYNSSGDSMLAYHNTIVFDDPSTTSGNTYGIYQSGTAKGIRIFNNLVHITRAGYGIKRCLIYLAFDSISPITSNNNILYLNAQGGINNALGQYTSLPFFTLQDWQANANNGKFDNASVSIDAVLTNPTANDIVPSNTAVDGIGANVGVTTDINGKPRTTFPDPGAFEITVVNCSNPVHPGNALSSQSTVCPGNVFSLSLTNNSQGIGQTYTWQKSANGISGWTNVAAISSSYTLYTTQNTSNYYRCETRCNAGAIAYSDTIMIVTPNAISGNLTVNSAIATGGTNFQTFTEAINYISCGGMVGPVTITAAAGSGPYNERIIIPQIAGASSTNKLTIIGNDVEVRVTINDVNNKAVVLLDGADNVVIENLKITALPFSVFAGAGWGILLTNQADSNIIKGCTIDCNITTANATYGGIFINGSVSSTATSGSNASHNLITENTINGGYWGIYLYGSSINSTQNAGNIIEKNTINDFYAYGIFASYFGSGVIIRENEFTRYTRPNSTLVAAVYLSTGCAGALVEKNRIHDLFDSQQSSTATCYGIYVGSKGRLGFVNKILNNIIFAINGNGQVYGIVNASADTMQAYHNTILFDEQNTTTSSAYGFYQNGIATGIDFRNNVISIMRAGVGLKRCVLLGTVLPKENIRCNNNVLYINVAAGVNNHLGQFGSTNYTTLTSWKTANSNAYDSASTDYNPTFTGFGSGDLIPTSVQCDNIGQNVGVSTDILGLPRSATTPDPGAYEFGGTVPVNLISFTGEKNKEINMLHWVTTNEVSNLGFEVQRSLDGKTFSKIGFVASKKAVVSSDEKFSYDLNDYKPFDGTNYYRLKQINLNGTYKLSNIVAIKNVTTNAIATLYPNPASGKVNLLVDNLTNDAKVIVTDVFGKQLIIKSVVNGNNQLNITALSKGLYFINIIDTKANITKKLIVE